MNIRKLFHVNLIAFTVGTLALIGLYLTSLYSFLLFHSLIELVTMIIAGGIFVLTWNSRRFLDNDYFLFIGIAYLFIVGIDSLHTLAYPGMGVFKGSDTNLAAQLWIAARYSQGISLLIAVFFIHRKLNPSIEFAGYSLAIVLLLMSIFYWHVFPTCFIEGTGLTPFKKISEYIISLMFLLAVVLLLQNRSKFDPRLLLLLIMSFLFTVAAEMVFTFYVGAYGLSNFVGHIFKLIASYYVYEAIIEIGLRRPYDLVFRDLAQSKEMLQHAHDKLELRIQDRTAELEKVNEVLREDITERKRVEEALRNSEARYRALVEQIPVIVYTDSAAQIGQTLYISPQLKTILGYDPQEWIEDNDLWLKIMHEDDRQRILAEYTRTFKTGDKFDAEFRVISRQGRIIWIHDEATLIRDPSGSPLSWQGIMKDRTEYKQAEEEIRKLNAELEERVIMRTAQLEVANKELEAFAYSVSHDLRAPLRHITGFAELLSTRYLAEIPDKGQHYLDTIKDSARQMGVLIDDLLQFSRTGRMEMRESTLDMNRIVEDVKEELNQDNSQCNIEWSIAQLPSVQGDHAMMQLVWMNLLCNAVKFTRKRKKAKIEIGFREEGKEFVFYVRDNGVGFDMQYAGKLFGVFQRLHSVAEFEGTGIGLANVQRIVLRHGGRTWAEAELNKGATFYFSIPK